MVNINGRCVTTVLACLVVLSGTALAGDGDAPKRDLNWKAQVRAVNVGPNDSSGALTGIAGSGVGVNSDTTADLSFRYMFQKQLGIELSLLDSRHDVSGKGSIAALGKVAETRFFPATLTLVYVFSPDEKTRPYVGLGVTSANFHSEKSTAVLDTALGGLSSVTLDDKAAFALQGGCDFGLGDRWFLNLDAKYMWINTTATVTTGAAVRNVAITIDPLIIGGGVGVKF